MTRKSASLKPMSRKSMSRMSASRKSASPKVGIPRIDDPKVGIPKVHVPKVNVPNVGVLKDTVLKIAFRGLCTHGSMYLCFTPLQRSGTFLNRLRDPRAFVHYILAMAAERLPGLNACQAERLP